MKSEFDDIQELAELEKKQDEITRRRKVILNRIEQRIRFSSNKVKKVFPSKVAAIEYILEEAGSPQHVKKITATLAQYGLNSNERTISGMLRNYASQEKKFTAEGGNKFGLINWLK